MKITFLGTGTSQGVPVIACQCDVCTSSDHHDKRLRTSVMIQTSEKIFVIDTGPDFRQQMIREKVEKLDAILFTHEHKDHFSGLDDVRVFNHLQKKPMDVYADKRVSEAIKREYAYVFARDKYPGIPKLTIHTIDTTPFFIENIKIVPIRVMHFQLPILGFRINDFVYITDAKKIPDQEMEKLRNAKVLVINALRHKEHISHLSLRQSLEIIKQVKPRKAFLTHISHRLGRHAVVENQLPPNVQLAYDGLVLDIR